MELMFHWFWLVQLSLPILAFWLFWKWYKSKFKSKFYGITFGIIILLELINPIKMVPRAAQANKQMDYQISQRKMQELPPMVKDDSFKTKTDSVREQSIMNKEIN